MTGQEIRTLAELHAQGDTIDDGFALSIINECVMMNIGKDAGIVKAAPVMASAGTWTDLPNDLLEIIEIEKTGLSEPYFGRRNGICFSGSFDCRCGKIRFEDGGDYTVWYMATPSTITSLSEAPNIHAAFHYPIALFLASRFRSYDDEESQDAARLMNEYQAYRQKATIDIVKLKPTTRAAHRVSAGRWY